MVSLSDRCCPLTSMTAGKSTGSTIKVCLMMVSISAFLLQGPFDEILLTKAGRVNRERRVTALIIVGYNVLVAVPAVDTIEEKEKKYRVATKDGGLKGLVLFPRQHFPFPLGLFL